MNSTMSYIDIGLRCHHSIDLIPNPKDFPMHAHDMYEIFFFISGKGNYMVEGNNYKLHPNDILIMHQGETHKLQIEQSEPYERISIHFSSAVFGNLDSENLLLRPFNERPLGRLNQYRSFDFTSDHYLSCLNSISSVLKSPNNKRIHIISHLLSLISELDIAYDKQSNKSEQLHNSDISVEMVDYINNNLFGDISLESVSEHFYLSKSQINRIYKKATGSTVWEYVLIKRLMAARKQIQDGESAFKVCTNCGFRDYSAFYRAYKARFDCSPKASIEHKQ